MTFRRRPFLLEGINTSQTTYQVHRQAYDCVPEAREVLARFVELAFSAKQRFDNTRIIRSIPPSDRTNEASPHLITTCGGVYCFPPDAVKRPAGEMVFVPSRWGKPFTGGAHGIFRRLLPSSRSGRSSLVSTASGRSCLFGGSTDRCLRVG